MQALLPIIIIHRLECVLIDGRVKKSAEVLKNRPKLTGKNLAKLVKELELNPKQCPFSNTTDWTLRSVYEEDHALLEENFRAYINGLSKNVDDIIEHFNYRATIGLMVKTLNGTAYRRPLVVALCREINLDEPPTLSILYMHVT